MIRLLAPYQFYKTNQIVSFAADWERYLVLAGAATTDLTGGIPYIAPAAPRRLVPASLVVGSTGAVLGIEGPGGTLIAVGSSNITAPGALTGLTLTAAAGAVIAAFNLPSNNGGSPLTAVTVTLSNGQSNSGLTSPITIVTPAGTAVTATAKAANDFFESVASAVSNSVTPMGSTPSVAPAVLTAAAITGAPKQGVPLSITGATFSGSPTPTVTRVIRMDGTQVASGTQSTGYTPLAGDVGKIPSVTDTASNGVGSPAVSTGAGAAVIAAAASGVPSAPVIIAATENINDNTTAVVSYVAPSSNGGSALTGYTGVMTMEDGSTVNGTAAAGATSMNFTGVTALKSRSVVIKAVNANGSSAPSAVAKVATLRNIATRCSAPYESSPQPQALGHSTHYNDSGRTLVAATVVLANYYSMTEAAAGTLSAKVTFEYPPESGIQDEFFFSGALMASIAAGTNKFSDRLVFTNIVGGIPDGAAFRLKYFFQTTTGGRIPYCHNGSTSKYGAKYDLIRFGTSGQDRLTDDAATWNARVNDDASKNYCFKPLMILGYSTVEAGTIHGDSNDAGGGVDAASDTFLLCGRGERLVGRGGPFVNLSQSSEKLEDWLDASKALRRKEVMPYTQVRHNFYGTNTFANQTDVAALNALDVRFKNEWAPFNKLTTCTIPPKNTPLTGPYNTPASMGYDATQDVKRLDWSAARLAKTAVNYTNVFDIAPLLASPTDEHKWDVHPLGRNLTVNMTAGSNVITATTGTFSAADPTTELVCVTQASYAGSAPYISDGGLIGLMQYTDATHALMTDRLGVARPAGVTVTGVTMHIGLWSVTGDGVHGREAMYQRILPVALTAPL
jgi:hypothetical protein